MDMPKQEKAERRSTRDTEVDESVSTTSEAPGASSLDSDVDSILDEIDEVLEVNAEDFVKSFVQKGGQ
jgi:ubiquitin-like protein Pup